MIRHVVMWKFKDGEEENAKIFLSRLKALESKLDMLKKCEVGANSAPGDNYDAVLISEFDSFADLEAYKVHPLHLEVAALCKNIRVSRCAVDYEF